MTHAQPRIVRETIAYSHDRFDYERALREAKCDEDTIRRCLWANDMQRFNNFESYAQPSAATVFPGLAASLTAQPQPFPGSRHPSSSPATCASPPPMAAALYDPDSMDVTSDNEPDLPWDSLPGDFDAPDATGMEF